MAVTKKHKALVKTLDREELKTQVVSLYRSGLAMGKVAKQLDISAGFVHKLLKEAKENMRVVQSEDILAWTQEILERLDSMYQTQADAIDKGDRDAIDTGLKIIDRQMKILGVDNAESVRIMLGINEPNNMKIQIEYYDATPTQLIRNQLIEDGNTIDAEEE